MLKPLSLLAILLVLGCDSKPDTKATDKKPSVKAEEKPEAHTHGDWWCDEHGLKESDCSMCNPKVARAFREKGDWCKEHDRAKSQCFICEPKLKEKFAAEYQAKYNKAPPEPTGQKESK
jgi:hypothetical protein